MYDDTRLTAGAAWFLRIALAAGFLSAVADRFGLWGPSGAPGVAWGAWAPFVENVGALHVYVPAALYGPLAWIATVAEFVIGVGLIVGWRLRWFAGAAGLLLLAFALAMATAISIKAPLDSSVFTASAGAILLAAVARDARRTPAFEDPGAASETPQAMPSAIADN